MGAESKFLMILGTNGRTFTESKNLELIFKTLSVSADGNDNGLTISESSGKFSFNSKVLAAIGAATASGEAVEYDQYTTALGNKEDSANKGAVSGYCPLDASQKVPAANLPNAIMAYKGMWNASTNTPTLADGAGNADTDIGNVYKVSVAGSQDLGSGSISFDVGDYVILNSSKVWEKSDTTDAVTSVNSQTGAVVLNTSHISEVTNLYFTDARAKSAAVANAIVDDVTDVAPSQDAVYEALALKSDTTHNHDGTYAAASHNHTASEVTDFTAAAKTAVVDNAIVDDVTDKAPSQDAVYEALALKSDTTHNHDGVYATAAHNHDGTYAPASHNHTASEVTDFASAAKTAVVDNAIVDDVTDKAPSQDAVYEALALKSDTTHNHDSTYETIADRYASYTNEEGAGINAGQFVFMSSAGNVSLLDSTDAVNEDTLIGCVKATTIADSAAGEVWLPRKGTKIGGFTGLTIGTRLFAHASTPGSYTATRPTSGKVIVLGQAVSTTEITFEGYYDYEFGT